LVLLASLASACASPGAVRARDEVLHRDVAEARHSGAYRCAPTELATAEANLTFSERELADGHSMDAENFAELAEDAIKKALVLSKDCGPKEVVIQAPTPPVVVKIEPKDTDGDGIPDDIDRCPTVPGPKENFGCPWGDRDHDGIADNVDKCPDVPGIPELQGCPDVDTDGDGIPDRLDKCPLVKGIPELQGCPDSDRDGDGIPDRLDKCPDVPGVPPDGCPKKYKLVVVKKDRIEIKQQVHFATNKWRILKDSYDLLEQVASVLKDSPNIHVRVEGHTDSVGTPEHNMTLSQHRAESVSEFLVEHGVDASRLVSQGFGLTKPIASNASAIGRAQNRRSEFHILKADGTDMESESAPAPAGDNGGGTNP
jgi:outer membrane protein OmpA-like peptidoglycan-associated protein